MKAAVILLLTLLLVCPAYISAAGRCDDNIVVHHDNRGISGLQIDDGTVIINFGDHDGTMEITEDLELFVNGRFIETNDEQRDLLRDYRKLAIRISEKAVAIGLEGAKIGLEGAKIGLGAVSGLLQVLLTDMTMEDFERQVEKKSEGIERAAEKLEAKARVVEKMADEFEDLHRELRRQIPEVRALG